MSWEHLENVLKHSNGKSVPHPLTVTEWEDDMKKWPHVTYEDIFNYFVLSLGVDGSAMRNYKSTEAYQYLHSGKVGKVLTNEVDNDLVFLKADVLPSQSKTWIHSAWVLATTTGIIETVGCSCIAGQGKSCSHAAAILWKSTESKCNQLQVSTRFNLMLEAAWIKVHNAVSKGLTGMSCTDEQRQWNSGTQRNLVPKRLSDISFKHHKVCDDVSEQIPFVSPLLPPTPKFSSHSALKKGLEGAHIPIGSLLHKCISAEEVVPAVTSQLQQPHGEHGPDMQCQKCMSFYNLYVKLDEPKCTNLEEVTKTQSASHIWYDARKLRITASSAKKVPVRASTKPDNFVREHLFPRFHGNSATRYGQENEESARTWIESCGFTVERKGTVVSVTEPWLSASPDGVLNTTELLEIKCPVFSRHCTSLSDLFSGKLTDVKLVDGVPQLQHSGSRGYYLQVQLGMFCTGKERCKLVIWTPSEQVVIDVPLDMHFCSEVVPKLKCFYFTHMLPRIVDEFLCGRLTLCSKYIALCK